MLKIISKLFLLYSFVKSYKHTYNYRQIISRFNTHLFSIDTFISKPKIPSTAWRWPAAWPFDQDSFNVTESFKYQQLDSNYIHILNSHIKLFVQPGNRVLEITYSNDTLLDPNRYSSSVTVKTFYIDSRNAIFPLPFESDYFDQVVFSSGVEQINKPRDFFKEVWRVLKEEGRSLICFSSSPYDFIKFPVKIWTTMSDEQKIWIAGRFKKNILS